MAWSINADNGGGGGTAVWDKARALWKQAGIQDFPWMHVRSMADLQRLVSVAEAKDSPALGFNVEDVFGDKISLQQMGGYLLDFWVNRYEKPVHMATLPWVQNGQGWQYVSFAVAALEFFPDEQVIWPGGKYDQKIAQDCITHAFAEGLPNVTLMWKTKGYTPSDFGAEYSVCHSLYTADDIAPTQPAWAAWKAVPPCTRLKESPVPLTPTEKKNFRDQLRRFCLVAQKYDNRWHYTQQRPYTGLGSPASDTHYNDCSSYVAIAFYRASRNSGAKVDDPLGYHYAGWGNTGSCYQEMKKYPAPQGKYRIGDVALYLKSGGPGDHMTVCIKAGDDNTSVWSSFGTEAGPDERELHYRNDLTGVYRPEDLR
jgi:hypothetical protein